MPDKQTNNRSRMAYLLRIGNRAVREAQARNRELGIPNWYSLNGRLVSDTGQVETVEETPEAPKGSGIRETDGCA